MPIMDHAALIQAADEQVAKVRTQGKDYSFNELLSMYEDEELIIAPEYQRLFRWTEVQASRFIESVILELPLPPIFVIEITDGKYELIDGLQRISSYFYFRGKLDAEHRAITPGVVLTLDGCDIVKGLDGFTYETLPRALEIKLKRHTIRVEVIRKESESRIRYHMFKRLNKGGSVLSEQEIRNCTIRLLDDTVNQFLIDCTGNIDFVKTISPVNQQRMVERYDQELVLRFFAFKNWRDHYVHEVAEYLTEYMEAVADSSVTEVTLDYNVERGIFEKTFRILNASMAEDAFAIVDKRGRTLPFGVYHFEAFSLGLQPHLDALDPDNAEQMEQLSKCIWEIKRDDAFREITTGGGKNFLNRLTERIDFVSNRLGAEKWT
ncbi:hypothetical protein HG66A1_62560 [Gimesia chilikensis]|uniref:GmrSD restriction endonucleases N-terminal domain-containing protein n=2 Tax=Gimesia chilikensis TaxID=2605989 RepID=A0A517PYI8_9PLAN|nr:hypothetical protein HG66A1_62560 [Gimesia chilikensis]